MQKDNTRLLVVAILVAICFLVASRKGTPCQEIKYRLDAIENFCKEMTRKSVLTACLQSVEDEDDGEQMKMCQAILMPQALRQCEQFSGKDDLKRSSDRFCF